jgi:hypothetical protein
MPMCTVSSVDVLHHDGLAIAVGHRVENLDDVGVVDAGNGDRLAPEALGDHRVGCEVRLEELDRDLAVQGQVGAQPDLRHPALRDAPLEPVSPGEHGGS